MSKITTPVEAGEPTVPAKYQCAAFEWKLGYAAGLAGVYRNPVHVDWNHAEEDTFRRAAWESGHGTAAAKVRRDALDRAKAAVAALTPGGVSRLVRWMEREGWIDEGTIIQLHPNKEKP